MGYLTEELYRATLWDHQPITDFWHVAKGTQARLEHNGMRTMRDVANADPELLYRLFGVDAELLIDHAWGRESCLIEDIKTTAAAVTPCHSRRYSPATTALTRRAPSCARWCFTAATSL